MADQQDSFVALCLDGLEGCIEVGVVLSQLRAVVSWLVRP